MIEKDLTIQELRQKLKAYEDTGLTPEEMEDYIILCESYVKASLDAKFVQACIDAVQAGLTVKRLRELLEAEQGGRLATWPCNVGDLLYEVDLPEYGIITCKVLSINSYIGPMFHLPGNPMVSEIIVTVEVVAGHGLGSSYDFERDDFGKTVFFSREEAEAALNCREETHVLEANS